MRAFPNRQFAEAGQSDDGDGYPSPRPIGQIGIIRLVRWSDPHDICQ